VKNNEKSEKLIFEIFEKFSRNNSRWVSKKQDIILQTQALSKIRASIDRIFKIQSHQLIQP
jgi:hypothetical protein